LFYQEEDGAGSSGLRLVVGSETASEVTTEEEEEEDEEEDGDGDGDGDEDGDEEGGSVEVKFEDGRSDPGSGPV